MWRRGFKYLLYGGSRMFGLHATLRWTRRHAAPVICYHSVTDRSLPPQVYARGLHIAVDQFREQMEYVRRHYRVVALKELVAAALAGDRFPPGSLAITFDDGYANVFAVA